jgi:hypothetical protein
MAFNEHSFRNYPSLPVQLKRGPVSPSHIERSRRRNLSQALGHTLDRVNVLGNDSTYGHTGQVYWNDVASTPLQ